MNKERITIEDMLNIPIGTIAGYEAEQLYELLGQSIAELERVKRSKQWIEAAIGLKYEEQVRAKRLRLEKDTGVVHLEDNGFKISSEAPKKVQWDQDRLTEIAANIAASGGNVADYIETYYNVPENKYNSWSQAMRDLFTPARVVTLGKATYKLTRLNGEVGL